MSIAGVCILIMVFFTIFPFSSTEKNIYGQSFGEGGYCYNKFDLVPVGKYIINFKNHFYYFF